MSQAAEGKPAPRWDQRLYPGLRVESVPPELRATLVQAAGALGVEAEYLLGTLKTFLTPPTTTARSRQTGEVFLWQLEASAARLRSAADAFELATQAFLSALDANDPDLRTGAVARSGEIEPWWSAPPDATAELAPLDLSLRQCGFSYRQCVAARLASSVEALAEHLTLLLHALDTLPPVGVLPVPSLYAGLYELASTFQGHVVPHLLADVSPDATGLLAAIRRFRALDSSEDRSIEADLAWARAQLQDLHKSAEQSPAKQRDTSSRRGILSGLLRRATTPVAPPASSPEAWVAMAEREWREAIAALEAIRTQEQSATPRKP